MSLAKALQQNRDSRKGPRCTVCELVDKLDPQDKAALLDAFKDEAFTHAAITRALKAEGHHLSAITVGRHRKGECRG